jgi:hypothetical protein
MGAENSTVLPLTMAAVQWKGIKRAFARLKLLVQNDLKATATLQQAIQQAYV